VDFKLPSSGIVNEKPPEWFSWLTNEDVIKFVIASTEDFYTAERIISYHADRSGRSGNYPSLWFSPCLPMITPRSLVDMMRNSKVCRRFDIGFNLQIHKYIFDSPLEK
jgi:hypothetical protein